MRMILNSYYHLYLNHRYRDLLMYMISKKNIETTIDVPLVVNIRTFSANAIDMFLEKITESFQADINQNNYHQIIEDVQSAAHVINFDSRDTSSIREYLFRIMRLAYSNFVEEESVDILTQAIYVLSKDASELNLNSTRNIVSLTSTIVEYLSYQLEDNVDEYTTFIYQNPKDILSLLYDVLGNCLEYLSIYHTNGKEYVNEENLLEEIFSDYTFNAEVLFDNDFLKNLPVDELVVILRLDIRNIVLRIISIELEYMVVNETPITITTPGLEINYRKASKYDLEGKHSFNELSPSISLPNLEHIASEQVALVIENYVYPPVTPDFIHSNVVGIALWDENTGRYLGDEVLDNQNIALEIPIRIPDDDLGCYAWNQQTSLWDNTVCELETQNENMITCSCNALSGMFAILGSNDVFPDTNPSVNTNNGPIPSTKPSIPITDGSSTTEVSSKQGIMGLISGVVIILIFIVACVLFIAYYLYTRRSFETVDELSHPNEKDIELESEDISVVSDSEEWISMEDDQ
eukprot:TRINITY_DN8438_c0_g1_i2.p1 TRINITY_DN8438_c0_g1~~TRINITY_DN8438_c0_g1_i2.p1  ORF type:complete len:520 (-),score=112.20 TRINITY_DN8438_c0_g1_i2:111-1670(-)